MVESGVSLQVKVRTAAVKSRENGLVVLWGEHPKMLNLGKRTQFITQHK